MSHPNDQYTRALQRLVDTLNSRGAAERVARAFAADAVLERFDPGETEGDSERIQGSHKISQWMARVPVTTKFALAGKCQVVEGRDPAAAKVRYRYEWNGFMHGGTWIVQLANDGRLLHWAHHPDVMTPQKQQAATVRSDETPIVPDGHGNSHAPPPPLPKSRSGGGGGGGEGGGGGKRRRRGGRGGRGGGGSGGGGRND